MSDTTTSAHEAAASEAAVRPTASSLSTSALADPLSGATFGAVQADGGSLSGDVHATADAGLRSASSSLPHFDAIQASFGAHDISGVKAHTGPAAKQAASDMGANAYAKGNHVALSDTSDLHTTAHEAAHVVVFLRGRGRDPPP